MRYNFFYILLIVLVKLDYRENRQKVIDWTKQQLIGNYRIEDNVLKGNPLSLFHTGFLAAISKDDSEFEEVESINEDQANHNSRLGDEGKPAQKTLRYMPPSSAGFSFYVAGDNIELRVYYNAFGYEDIQIRSDTGNTFLK